MKLTPQEKEELKTNTLARKLFEELESFKTDPGKELALAIVDVSKVISNDLKVLSGKIIGKTKILGNDKDDKVFERIDKIISNAAKYYQALKEGREYSFQDELKQKSDTTKNSEVAEGSEHVVKKRV